jgi:hypothetical protein
MMMNMKNLLVNFIRLALVINLIFSSGFTSYSQNGRPRYSKPQSSQNPDMIPADTVIGLRMDTYLSSKNAHVGDKFSATVTIPVYVDGQVAIPSGATISGRVTQVTPAKRMNKSGVIAIEFDEITLPNGLSTQIVGVLTSDDPETQKQIDDENRVSGGKGKDATVFVGGSGILGAILGGVSGGGKGAAVGGAVGAGVGVAAVLLSKGEEATVPVGTEFGIRLKQPLPVPTGANIYDPAADNNSTATQPNASSNANAQDSAAEARARASQDPPRDTEIANRSGRTEPQNDSINAAGNTANVPPSAREPQPSVAVEENDVVPVEEDLPLSSQEMIRRAQQALNYEGYYEGAIDGVMTQRVVNALKAYQSEHHLSPTGALDMETAKSLRIVGAAKTATNNKRPPLPAASQRQNTDVINRDSESASSARTPSGANAERSASNPSTRPSTTSQPSEPVSRPRSLPDSQNQSASSTATAVELQRQAAELLAEYQKLIGVRMTGSGIELDGKATSDDEISLLYAFDSFANSTQLYARLLPSLQSPQSIRSATLAMAKEARKTDKVFTTSTTRWANRLNPKWDTIRQEVLKLMYAFHISASELDN